MTVYTTKVNFALSPTRFTIDIRRAENNPSVFPLQKWFRFFIFLVLTRSMIMVRVLFLIQPHLHEKLPLAKPLAISKMARCSKKQKCAVILRRKRLLQRCFFHFEKSSFLVKTVLLKKIQKLDVACEEYNRNPRRVGRKRSTD